MAIRGRPIEMLVALNELAGVGLYIRCIASWEVSWALHTGPPQWMLSLHPKPQAFLGSTRLPELADRTTDDQLQNISWLQFSFPQPSMPIFQGPLEDSNNPLNPNP